MKRVITLTALACLIVFPRTSHATPIVDFTNDASSFTWFGNNLGCDAGCMLGYELTVSSTVSIDALGVYDSGADGLNSSHDVGIWTSGGTLLASTSVGPSSTLVDPSVSGDGQWVYSAISQLTLGPGSYVLAAFYGVGTTDPVVFQATGIFSNDPGATYVVGQFANSGSFGFPTNTAASDRYFGAAARLSEASEVPEPASLVLLGTGLIAGVRRYRRRSS